MIYMFLAAIVGAISGLIDYKYNTKSFRYIVVFMLGIITAYTFDIIRMINEIIK